MQEILVCQRDEIADGQVRIVRQGDLEIGVIRYKGDWFAYRNLCPHQGGPACEGVRMFGTIETIVEGGVSLGHSYDEADMHIVCPWHGYEFHLADGVHVRDSRVRLQKFPVHEREDAVYVTSAAEFADLASRIAAACAEAIEHDRVEGLPDDLLGQALASLIRLYAAKAQLGALPPAFGRNSGIAITDVAIGCTAMMEAADLSLFDLGAWQSLSGVGRRILPRDAPPQRGNVNHLPGKPLP